MRPKCGQRSRVTKFARSSVHCQGCVDTGLAYDPLLRRSFHAAGQPAAFQVRTGLLIARLQLNVSQFRLVLARRMARHTGY